MISYSDKNKKSNYRRVCPLSKSMIKERKKEKTFIRVSHKYMCLFHQPAMAPYNIGFGTRALGFLLSMYSEQPMIPDQIHFPVIPEFLV